MDLPQRYLLMEDNFSSTAEVVFRLMDTPLPLIVKTIMAPAIDLLVASGDWDNINQLLVLLDTLNNSLTDWKGNQNALVVASPVFTAYTEIRFNGLTNYVNTQKTNNGRFNNYGGLFTRTGSSGGSPAPFGARSGGPNWKLAQSASALRTFNHDGSGMSFVSSIVANTYFSIVRSSDTARDLRKNGVSQVSDAQVTSGTTTHNTFIGCINNAGTAANFWAGGMRLYIDGNKDLDDLFVYNTIKTMLADILALAA